MCKKLKNNSISDKNFYLNVLKNDSKNYEAILKLGLIDVKENNFSLAKEKFKKLLSIDRSRYEGYLNLSNIYSYEGKNSKANKILYNFLNDIEENIEIINTLAINLFNIKKINELEKHITKFINKYQSFILYYLQGYTLIEAGKFSESESFFKNSISLNPNFWNNYDFLLKQYEKQSRLKDFKHLIDSAKKIFKNSVKLYYYESLFYFRTGKYKQSLNILTNKKNKENFLYKQSEVERADYFHLLSRVHEKMGLYSESYNFAIRRNNTIFKFKENKNFNKDLILKTISSYKSFFDKKNKPKLLNLPSGINHSNLVFLVGFPRSGTTLLDTILRSHSKTMVLEEKPYLLDIRHKFYEDHQLDDILHISEAEKIKMQESYFNSFDYNCDQLVIDKYPLNLIELGFIKTIFPNAKIILAIRHPLDCIISCVLTAFKMNDAMVNFENIQTTSFFYNECFELLFKYFYYYEINYYKIKYENVVMNFNDEIRKLLNFLNLHFEQSINDFQSTAMQREKINTPSYDQVIKPIYSSSVNRYKNFDEINNIEIDINYWINKFSY